MLKKTLRNWKRFRKDSQNRLMAVRESHMGKNLIDWGITSLEDRHYKRADMIQVCKILITGWSKHSGQKSVSATKGVLCSSVAADRLSLAPKRCVFHPRSSSNFVMRFTCTGKMLAYYLCSLIGHEYAAQQSNCIAKNLPSGRLRAAQ